MSRAKVIKKTIKDENLVNMFNQMLGGDGDPEIVARKTKDLQTKLKIVVSVLKSFGGEASPFRKKFDEYHEWCDEFLKFASEIEPLQTQDYKCLKDNNVIRRVILVCSEIVVYSHYLVPSDLNDRWVHSHPGLVFVPFKFTKMDVKHIWNNADTTSPIKKYCLQTISLLFNQCNDIYRIVSSPDIDVKKFSKIIVESIEKVKGIPKLSRCKEAFDKIKESVELLENNFDEYYRDMVDSENPNTIIENFIVDVSKGQNMNISLMKQFRTIINFYKEQSAGKIKDPKTKKIFDTLQQKMDILERKVAKSVPGSANEVEED